MGAWGSGSFENDDALDWTSKLETAEDSRILGATLDRVMRCTGAELEAWACSEALAAAEVVAALRDQPAEELPDEIGSWVESKRGRHEQDLAPPALKAVERIRADSELKLLWNESGSEEWEQGLDDLEKRLKA